MSVNFQRDKKNGSLHLEWSPNPSQTSRGPTVQPMIFPIPLPPDSQFITIHQGSSHLLAVATCHIHLVVINGADEIANILVLAICWAPCTNNFLLRNLTVGGQRAFRGSFFNQSVWITVVCINNCRSIFCWTCWQLMVPDGRSRAPGFRTHMDILVGIFKHEISLDGTWGSKL